MSTLVSHRLTCPTPNHLATQQQSFLESNLSKGKKISKNPLGVVEPLLATAIQENLGVPCRSDESIRELCRGIRAHFTKFVKPLEKGGLEQAQLGLGHAYSRSKVRLCVWRVSCCRVPVTCCSVLCCAVGRVRERIFIAADVVIVILLFSAFPYLHSF